MEQLRIQDIRLEDPANHFIEVVGSLGARVNLINAAAVHVSPNSDGINFYGGFDQSLTNSVISNGDDCVSVVRAASCEF